MGTTNGNGRSKKFFKAVSEAAGRKDGVVPPYAPDFLDSLVRRMATADLDEATFAWVVYRSSGNHSLRAIHLYSWAGSEPEETPLRQRDAALDLAWLRAGQHPAWLDAPRKLFEDEASRRGIEAIAKTLICDSFTEHRRRGTIASGTGHDIFLIPSPKVAGIPEFHRTKGERSKEYETYCDEWNVAHSAEFHELEVARATVERITKLRLAGYKNSRKSPTPRTNGAPSLESLESLESSSSLPVNGTETTTTLEPDFHAQHVATWEAAGKDGVPTPKQSATALSSLGKRNQEFLRWLTPHKLRRVQHPGALPNLVKEFLQTALPGPPENGHSPRCWKCGRSLDNGSVDGECFTCAAAIGAST